MVAERFTVEPNHCGCHPETCGCAPWVVLKDGEPHSAFYRRSTADEVAAALNATHGVPDVYFTDPEGRIPAVPAQSTGGVAVEAPAAPFTPAHGLPSEARGAWKCSRCGFRGFWSGGPHECAPGGAVCRCGQPPGTCSSCSGSRFTVGAEGGGDASR